MSWRARLAYEPATPGSLPRCSSPELLARAFSFPFTLEIQSLRVTRPRWDREVTRGWGGQDSHLQPTGYPPVALELSYLPKIAAGFTSKVATYRSSPVPWLVTVPAALGHRQESNLQSPIIATGVAVGYFAATGRKGRTLTCSLPFGALAVELPCGGLGGIRTHNLLGKGQLLCSIETTRPRSWRDSTLIKVLKRHPLRR